MRIARVVFALVVLVLFSVVCAAPVVPTHVSTTAPPVDVWEQKSTQQVCEELRDALNKKENVTDFFTPRWRFAYLTRELPFGDDYTGMCGIRRFMHLIHSHIENPKCSYEVHAVDEGMELCVLKSMSSGKWRRSGREFHDIDHYWEFKAFNNKIVGGRLFDGEKAKEFIESYRTPAQQAAYGLASAIFGHGYKSKEAKDHLSADAHLMLHPSGFTRYGPQVFKGNDAVAQAVDFVERAMKDRGGWRYGPHEPHHLHDREHDRVDGRGDRDDDDDDDKKKPDGRGPFPLPLPYMGHWWYVTMHIIYLGHMNTYTYWYPWPHPPVFTVAHTHTLIFSSLFYPPTVMSSLPMPLWLLVFACSHQWVTALIVIAATIADTVTMPLT